MSDSASPSPAPTLAAMREEFSTLWQMLGGWIAEVARPDANLAPSAEFADRMKRIEAMCASALADSERWQWVRENGTRLSEPLVNAATGGASGESLCSFTFRLPTASLFHANPDRAITDAARLASGGE